MPAFKIGLTMAGAISAGAYTAGVFDMLMEALDEWEKAKTNAGSPDVPRHEAVISVITGASAGGITGALGLAALADASAGGSIPQVHTYPEVGPVTTTLPRLYSGWVVQPRFVSIGPHQLLGTADLANAPPIRSLLDTTILSWIVDESLLGITAIRPPRPYIAKDVHLYFTHTNLRGVPYEIGFGAGGPGQPGYPMLWHADHVHYRVAGVGSATFSSPWADADPARDLDVTTLSNLTALSPPWRAFGEAALGSGAFPVGLSARIIEGPTVRDYTDRQWPIDRCVNLGTKPRLFRLDPSFPQPLAGDPNAPVPYVTVDGGTIDNEPFELARRALMANPPDKNPREGAKSDRAVVLIDPFPEPPIYDAVGNLDNALTTVIGKLLPALKNQSRFKLQELVDALDKSVYTRFLIAPRRRTGPNAPVEEFGIACGLLGGFGGFLKEEFRAHDYQLGRLNGWLFLKRHFALPDVPPPDGPNSIVAAGYGSPHRPTLDHLVVRPDPPTAAAPLHYPIIPLVGRAEQQPQAPIWPRANWADLEEMIVEVKKRAEGLFGKLKEEQIPSRLFRLLASLAWWAYGEGKIGDYVRWTVVRDLIRRDQLSGPTPESDGVAWPAGLSSTERKVLAALAHPSFELRTAAGISRETGVSRTEVELVLSNHSRLVWEGRKSEDGAQTFTLKERKPSWWTQLPILRQGKEWFVTGAPAIG